MTQLVVAASHNGLPLHGQPRTQAQRLAELQEENAALKAAGSARGRVLRQSRAVIDAYLQRSAVLAKPDAAPAVKQEAQQAVEAVDAVTSGDGPEADTGHGSGSGAGLLPAVDGITTG